MSSSNAAAIRRRATPVQTTPPPPLPNPSTTNAVSRTTPSTQGLTLQQVISTFDKRITELETNLKSAQPNMNNTLDAMQIDNLPSIIQEFNSRFEMIAEEISSIKDVLMKLQSFTMEVNKSLYDERIHVLSDLGNSVSGSTVDTRDQRPMLANIQTAGTSIDLKYLVENELASQNNTI
jgi:hypothetical protein